VLVNEIEVHGNCGIALVARLKHGRRLWWWLIGGKRDAHARRAGAKNRFDRILVVTCREEQRVQRLAERLKIDPEAARREVVRRMAAQLPDEEKIKAADYVIDNSGSLDATTRQVRNIYERLRAEAEAQTLGPPPR